jgi:hypothetical protein
MIAARGGDPLRFATFLAPNMLPVYRFLADRIGQRLGRPVEPVVDSSFDQFERGEAELGVICGLPYVWLAARQRPPVEPLAAPVLAGDPTARPLLDHGFIDHFAPVDDGAYDDIRAMLTVIEAAGWTSLAQTV